MIPKVLGKATQIAQSKNQYKEYVINEMLVSYRATPQPASNHTRGNFIF